MIACRELAIPPNIDILYVEQEVEADNSTPVEVVLKADTKRTELLAREKYLQSILDNESNDQNDLLILDQQLKMNQFLFHF